MGIVAHVEAYADEFDYSSAKIAPYPARVVGGGFSPANELLGQCVVGQAHPHLSQTRHSFIRPKDRFANLLKAPTSRRDSKTARLYRFGPIGR